MAAGVTGFAVVPLRAAHAAAVRALHQEGLDAGDASFETTAPAWDAFDAAHLPDHRFVAADGDRVLGWVACSRVSGRRVYAGVVEHSVYVGADARGRGVGRALLAALIASTEAAGVWTIQAGVFGENTPSLALHAAAGFRVVGVRERLGRHGEPGGVGGGRWRDVVLLERRSAVVG